MPHIFSFTSQQLDTANNEPPPEFETILRVIEASNATVYNVLIDVTSVEGVVLFENDDEARRVMSSHNVCLRFSMLIRLWFMTDFE